ncbi:hypothetical protein ElyMa_004406800, partial [Elysia marginata]
VTDMPCVLITPARRAVQAHHIALRSKLPCEDNSHRRYSSNNSESKHTKTTKLGLN